MTNTFAFSEICIDAVREIANVGLGNAMMALSTMIDQGVNMAIPDVNIVPLSAFTKMAGGAESISACVYMPVEGDAPGVSLFSCRKPVRFASWIV